MPLSPLQSEWLWVPQQLWKVRGGKPRAALKKFRFHQNVCKEKRETAIQNSHLQHQGWADPS